MAREIIWSSLSPQPQKSTAAQLRKYHDNVRLQHMRALVTKIKHWPLPTPPTTPTPTLAHPPQFHPHTYLTQCMGHTHFPCGQFPDFEVFSRLSGLWILHGLLARDQVAALGTQCGEHHALLRNAAQLHTAGSTTIAIQCVMWASGT